MTAQHLNGATFKASILNETVIGLAAAARRLPPLRAGRPVHPATLTRWIDKGIIGPGGQRVKLEALRVGASWVTSTEAIQRFCDALSVRPDGNAAAPPVRTPGQRQRASEAAAKQLELAGI
jgi:Protein of unknown function (DUF1580)